LSDAVAALRRVNRHVADLTAISDDTMQAADADESAGVIPGRQMDGFALEFIFLGTGWFVPWFAQDFPAQRIVRIKLRFGSWRTYKHESKEPASLTNL